MEDKDCSCSFWSFVNLHFGVCLFVYALFFVSAISSLQKWVYAGSSYLCAQYLLCFCGFLSIPNILGGFLLPKIRHRYFIRSYLTLLFLMLFGEIIAGVLFITYKFEGLKYTLKDYVEDQFLSNENINLSRPEVPNSKEMSLYLEDRYFDDNEGTLPKLTNGMNKIQYHLKCCGLNGSADYDEISLFTDINKTCDDLPCTCYPKIDGSGINYDDLKKIDFNITESFTKGCDEALTQHFVPQKSYDIIISFMFSSFQFLSILYIIFVDANDCECGIKFIC